jgi:hypothetical protein
LAWVAVLRGLPESTTLWGRLAPHPESEAITDPEPPLVGGERAMSEDYRLGDVYGVTRDLPLNYVARADIDGTLIEALTRDKHIVIHGSSKQGKTSLRKWNLNQQDYIVVSCQSKWTLEELHAAILKRVGYRVEQSQSRTAAGGQKVNVFASARLSAKLFGSGPGAEAETGVSSERHDERALEVVRARLELDPSDPNDIIAALDEVGFDKFIVLEDFHYLPDDTQAEFAVALKAFHEASALVFIVVGVWLDENRLVQHNGDLTGRVLTVSADSWTTHELQEVIQKGEGLLNFRFASGFVDSLIEESFDSVWVIQESCYRACDDAGIYSTQTELVDNVAQDANVPAIVRDVVDAQSARYNGFLEHFPSGFQTTEFEMYRWLMLPILASDPSDLEKGIHINTLRRVIDAHHPKGPVNDMNYLHALRMTSSLQVRKNIKPIILDYDHTSRKLTVVDRGFLIWLQHQDREGLLRHLGLPVPSHEGV